MVVQLIDAPSITATPNGQQSPNGKPHLGFSEMMEVWISFLEAEEKSPTTTITYRWNVGQFVAFCEREGITPETLTIQHTAAYAAEVRKRPGRIKAPKGEKQQITPGGRFALLKDCRNFLNWIHKHDLMDRKIGVPVPKQPKTNPKRLKTVDEREGFLEAARGGRNVRRDELFVMFMLETGLRRMEILACNWGDLVVNGELGTPKVHVRKGKGRKERWVPMPMEVWAKLQVMKAEIEEERGPEAVADNAPVFTKENGRRFTNDTIRMLFNRLSERAGFKVTPHQLRHTYGRTMAKRGLPLPVLQNYMGHADIKTTMIYAELDEDDGLDLIYRKTMSGA